LKWASAPQNDVDGIYNKDWGCGLALKIPNHCTAHVYQNWVVGFCNPLYIPVKGRIRWVTPGQGAEDTWPKCPLK